ncbi:hypothetical protein EDF20_0829 [Frigoribacterium sp. PhB116]|jgi:hypothetical protein|nr:hypothetical protein EDF18_0830 [Frigoribacterium sp. PhB107]TDT66025.1 hypothetical protein EDF20_0829 [Frigoribacterium sp. PhB116]
MVAYWNRQIKDSQEGSSVTEQSGDTPPERTGRSATPSRPALFWLLVLLLAAEAALLAVATAYLLIEILTVQPDSYAAAAAILLLTLIATVWLGAIVVGALRGRGWIRGAAIVWQVLQIAVGVGSLQGTFANPSVGLWLIVPAVLVVVLLLVPSVVAVTSARDDAPPRTY